MGRFYDELNEQVARELAASHQYLAIAVWFDAETLPNLAAHFYRQALEERNHALMMVKFLLDSDQAAVIPDLGKPQASFADPQAPVTLALEQERAVTAQIRELFALAREEGEHGGEQFLLWFLEEQREEESSMSDLLKLLERASETNILLAEDYLAHAAGEEGVDPGAPPAAGGAL